MSATWRSRGRRCGRLGWTASRCCRLTPGPPMPASARYLRRTRRPFPERSRNGIGALSESVTMDFRVHPAGGVVVLQGQLSAGIRPRAGTGIGYMVGRDDLGRHAAAALGATRLVGQRLSDEGKGSSLGLGLLDCPAGWRQPLSRLGIRGRLGWRASFDAHPGARELVAGPAVHTLQNIG